MLKTLALFVLMLVVLATAGLAIYAATKPDSFRVERRTVIQAPPEKIYPLINDLQAFTSWSPYDRKDPAMKRSFSGPQAGPGALYAWDGNREIGAGSMQIVESRAPDKVLVKLDFVRPFKVQNHVEFLLAPQPAGTEVTWAMHGPSPYVSKLMGTIFDMDKMIGRDFEAGLANLKALAEK
ncbi:MAG TPA: SRPBCC family protein [Methylibium sp.]|uniref:SRPBCC family protein n=1 Tax=Methylibium sp. TaxID=2067992 RepID=UPI002DB861E1|nr:SRPBCC family protein [Methylibium sp.]HEU4459834.1 SRPBCC family protein [Methylibium sp.]